MNHVENLKLQGFLDRLGGSRGPTAKWSLSQLHKGLCRFLPGHPDLQVSLKAPLPLHLLWMKPSESTLSSPLTLPIPSGICTPSWGIAHWPHPWPCDNLSQGLHSSLCPTHRILTQCGQALPPLPLWNPSGDWRPTHPTSHTYSLRPSVGPGLSHLYPVTRPSGAPLPTQRASVHPLTSLFILLPLTEAPLPFLGAGQPPPGATQDLPHHWPVAAGCLRDGQLEEKK